MKGGVLMDAHTLVAGLRRDLAEVEERITANPWLADLESGRLPAPALRAFAGEQLHIIPSDLRSFDMLGQRFPGEPAHGYAASMLAGERVALDALDRFATAVGLDSPARESYEPVPGCQAYPSYVARLSRDGTALRLRVPSW
jgi:thiaminase